MKSYSVTRPFFDRSELEMISATLSSGWVAQGAQVAEFEKRISAHEGVKHGVATTSCTTALHLAMVAKGLGAGMDAIAPAFTFVATENAIVMTGATPILVDIERNTYNIDPNKIEETINTKYIEQDGKLVNRDSGNTLWGIVPVHQFGLCCDMERINGIARKYHVNVLEDAACALGAKIGNTHEGAFGNTSCLSFHPRKSITTGEGGMVLTDEDSLALMMKKLRSHGNSVSAIDRDKHDGFLLPEFDDAGYNYRMTDIQGAMGVAQAEKLDAIIERKRELATVYTHLIHEKIQELIPPVEPDGYFHTYQTYVCMLNLDKMGVESIEDGGSLRNLLQQSLASKGIATRQGTHAVHLLGYYKRRFGFHPRDFINAYMCDRLTISLPLYYGLTASDIEDITERIEESIDEECR